MRTFFVLCVHFLVCVGCHGMTEDDWMKTWILETDTLPTENSTGGWLVDYRKMAAVGNGHVATVVYSPTVYMNGLYNGPVGWTHRADIRATQDLTVSVQGEQLTRMYALDMWRAVFTETIRTQGLEIKVMTYAHQRLVQLLVSEIHVTRTDGNSKEFTLEMERSEINSTVDLAIDNPSLVTGMDGCIDQCMRTYGHTFITETEDAPIGEVHVYWTDIPPALKFTKDDKERTWIFLSSYDKERPKAQLAFQTAMSMVTSTPDLLRETHERAWAEKWNSGRIDVEGDMDLATIIHSSLYYILMSLPSTQPHMPLEQFYGLSPGSLARGANWTDYQGHVFWDMETWMYPPILVLFPSLARDMLSYRIYGGEGARAKARDHGYEGWQFPWESAFTGYEMTPLICVPCREYEQHITGDIAFAARQYWAASRDRKWLEDEGGINLIVQTATFWADRAEYNEEEDRYDINGVMPPDEFAQHINNSIYTNYQAKINLLLANYVSCLAGQQPSEAVSSKRLDVASKLHLVFNHTGNFHPEYEGYDNNETAYNNDQTVKQADTVMLGYPLGMKMDPETRRNDLLLYEERNDPDGPAMTWSMFAINWLDLGEVEVAATHFNNSYNWYRRPPFNAWTEAKSGQGASNFITGMGGFLQAVIFGYAGLRIELEHLSFNPRLPPNTHKMRVIGINYLEATFDLLIVEDHVILVVRETSDKFPLQLRTKSAGTTWRLHTGMELVLNKEPFEVTSLAVTECPMPEGSSCPDVVTVDNSAGTKAAVHGNIDTVLVSQTGADKCHDFLACFQIVHHHMADDDTINFYIGSDNRVYQGAVITTTAGTFKIALLGDYTLTGMSREQESLLRRLVKCGMEAEPATIASDYKLHFAAEPAEDCGTAPCAGNSLHCQLVQWLHWDSSQGGVLPECNMHMEKEPQGQTTPSPTPTTRIPLPTPRPWMPECPPVQPAEVTCNCRTQMVKRDVSNSASGVTSPVLAYFFIVAMLVFSFTVNK